MIWRSLNNNSTRRIMAGFLSLVIFCTQALFVHAAQTNFWKERRAAASSVQKIFMMAQLPQPAPFQNSSPSALHFFPNKFKSQISKLTTQKPILINLVKDLSRAGVVRDIQPGRSHNIVIAIQDVHGHSEAQQNISSMIINVLDSYPSALLGLEGAVGRIPIEKFRSESNEMNKEVGSFFLNTNLITGAEYAGFASKQSPTMVGMENAQVYQGNIEAVKQALPLQQKLLPGITQEKRRLSKLKIKVYSPDMLTLDRASQEYEHGNLGLGDYLTRLAQRSSSISSTLHLFIKTWELENKLNFDRAQWERTEFLNHLVGKLTKNQRNQLMEKSVALRSGETAYPDYYDMLQKVAAKAGVSLDKTPEFKKYISYVLQSDAIEADKLLREINNLEKSVWESLCQTEQQKELYEALRRLSLTEKLVWLTLTPHEWGEYKKIPPHVVQWGGKEGYKLGIPDLPILNHGEENPFEAFYKSAEARNVALSSNLIKHMQNSKFNVAILVAGGFHSEGLKELLKGDATLITVSPKLSQVSPSQNNEYLSVFTREKTPLEKLFESPKISLVNPLTLAARSSTPVARLSKELPRVIASLSGSESITVPSSGYEIHAALPGRNCPGGGDSLLLEGKTNGGIVIRFTRKINNLFEDVQALFSMLLGVSQMVPHGRKSRETGKSTLTEAMEQLFKKHNISNSRPDAVEIFNVLKEKIDLNQIHESMFLEGLETGRYDPSFDKIRFALTLNEDEITTIFSEMNIKPVDTLLEIGPGYSLLSLIAALLGAHVTVVEPHEPFRVKLSLVAQQLRPVIQKHGGKYQVVPTQLEDVPKDMNGKKFNHVIALDVITQESDLGHLSRAHDGSPEKKDSIRLSQYDPESNAIIANLISRYLTNTGTLYLSLFRLNNNDDMDDPNFVTRILKSQGFKIVSQRNVSTPSINEKSNGVDDMGGVIYHVQKKESLWGASWFTHPRYKKWAAVIETLVARGAPIVGLITYHFLTHGNLSHIGSFGAWILVLGISISFWLMHLFRGGGFSGIISNRDVTRLTLATFLFSIPLLFLSFSPMISLTIYFFGLIPLTVYHYYVDNVLNLLPEGLDASTPISRVVIACDVDGVLRPEADQPIDPGVAGEIKSLLATDKAVFEALSGSPVGHVPTDPWRQDNIPLGKAFTQAFRNTLPNNLEIYGDLGSQKWDKSSGEAIFLDSYTPKEAFGIMRVVLKAFLEKVRDSKSLPQPKIDLTINLLRQLEQMAEPALLDQPLPNPLTPSTFKPLMEAVTDPFREIMLSLRDSEDGIDPGAVLVWRGAGVGFEVSTPEYNLEDLRSKIKFSDIPSLPELQNNNRKVSSGSDYVLVTKASKDQRAFALFNENKPSNDGHVLYVTIGDGGVDFPMHGVHPRAHVAFHVGKEKGLKGHGTHIHLVRKRDGSDPSHIEGTVQILKNLREGLSDSSPFGDFKLFPSQDGSSSWRLHSLHELKERHGWWGGFLQIKRLAAFIDTVIARAGPLLNFIWTHFRSGRSLVMEKLIQDIERLAEPLDLPPRLPSESDKKKIIDRFSAYYKAILDVLDLQGVFTGATVVYPASGIDGFPAIYAPTIAFDWKTTYVNKKTVLEFMGLHQESNGTAIGDNLTIDDSDVVHAINWMGLPRVKKIQGRKIILLKGIQLQALRAANIAMNSFLDDLNTHLSPGDQVLILDNNDIQQSRRWFEEKNWKDVLSRIPSQLSGRIETAIRKVAYNPINAEQRLYVNASATRMAVPTALFLYEKPDTPSHNAPGKTTSATVAGIVQNVGGLQSGLIQDGFNFSKTRSLVNPVVNRAAPKLAHRFGLWLLRFWYGVRPAFYASKTRELPTNHVAGFDVTALMDSPESSSEEARLTREHVLARINAFVFARKTSPDVLVVRSSKDAALVEEHARATVVSLANPSHRALMERYLQNVVIVIESSSDRASLKTIFEKAQAQWLGRSESNYHFDFFTVSPDQYDLGTLAENISLYSLLPGLCVVPISQLLRGSYVSSIHA